MLLRYKKTYEKIAMGLLSYMPGDKSAKQLQEAIHQYETDEDWQLYLAKKEDDIIGLIGIEVKDDAYILHHLSVNPSYRGEGVGQAIVSKLQSLFPAKKCFATNETESFIKKCIEKEEGAGE
ncbi:GNAT family N-acetyltransferase [Sporosarcina sp. HYO08]|uniref:GNAT family N-acetyltransferase n=1 Tax=Sporosarcina sp. HYO08 TaxID=1759557 RepID=UPI00079AD246|nr:GNAT family N-acetyltransferase [Sporosarcina sp. HYO08]KXH82110.1 hypothetical protein AU377_07345 [Sporosarcina sp. HYO08]